MNKSNFVLNYIIIHQTNEHYVNVHQNLLLRFLQNAHNVSKFHQRIAYCRDHHQYLQIDGPLPP